MRILCPVIGAQALLMLTREANGPQRCPIFPARRASRRNGRNCRAISIGGKRCASSIAAPIGWCVPTRRGQSPPCSAKPMSRCRREPDKPPRRRPRPPQNPPQNAEADPGVVPSRLEVRRKWMKIIGLSKLGCAPKACAPVEEGSTRTVVDWSGPSPLSSTKTTPANSRAAVFVTL